MCNTVFVALKRHYKRCDKCRVRDSVRETLIPRKIYNYKREARKRMYSWDLTDEQASRLFMGQCHYCGKHASNGIDRVDNSKGYFLENCVSCCSACNFMKGSMDLEEFIDHIHKIRDFQWTKQPLLK